MCRVRVRVKLSGPKESRLWTIHNCKSATILLAYLERWLPEVCILL